jgi:hypothetical protein
MPQGAELQADGSVRFRIWAEGSQVTMRLWDLGPCDGHGPRLATKRISIQGVPWARRVFSAKLDLKPATDMQFNRCTAMRYFSSRTTLHAES